MDVECFIHEILAPGFSPAPEGKAGTKGASVRIEPSLLPCKCQVSIPVP